ncbi:phage portal protein [Isoptericola sp. QY 916]|uniref:phage portal protein n=1 Tax=Isoptericola sp. QY 916 TaxID=2782570 RepID=UPI003D2FF8B3|nr:phage portal protein [Isoptericola sp. QY 916]
MATTAEEVLQLATLLSEKITARRPEVQEANRYFRGQEGRMRFASDEFREYFAKRFVGFSDNWCMPVAQAPVERIAYLGMRLPDARELAPAEESAPLPQRGAWGADPDLARTWERNDAQRGLNEALLMMTIAKRSFAMVGTSPDGARITFENPDSAAVTYDGATGKRRAGLVVWEDDTKEYAELLLPDGVVPLERAKVAADRGDRRVPPELSGWNFSATREFRPHKLGAVPLVEFRNQSLLDNDPISDIGLVMPMQDSINLVWAYLLNALDYASLPGRVILNGEMPKEDILDKETGEKIGERPMELDSLIRDRVAWLTGGNSGQPVSIAEWKPATLDGFSKVIEQAVAHIAAQTRTPSHYLIASSSANVPAAGYELAEAGLVSKASERISYADAAVREVNRLSALAEGDTARADRIAVGKVLWKKPQFRSEAQLMDGLQKMRGVGFPMRWIAEEYGLSPAEVDRVMDMIREENTDPTLERMGRDVAALTTGRGDAAFAEE